MHSPCAHVSLLFKDCKRGFHGSLPATTKRSNLLFSRRVLWSRCAAVIQEEIVTTITAGGSDATIAAAAEEALANLHLAETEAGQAFSLGTPDTSGVPSQGETAGTSCLATQVLPPSAARTYAELHLKCPRHPTRCSGMPRKPSVPHRCPIQSNSAAHGARALSAQQMPHQPIPGRHAARNSYLKPG